MSPFRFSGIFRVLCVASAVAILSHPNQPQSPSHFAARGVSGGSGVAAALFHVVERVLVDRYVSLTINAGKQTGERKQLVLQ